MPASSSYFLSFGFSQLAQSCWPIKEKFLYAGKPPSKDLCWELSGAAAKYVFDSEILVAQKIQVGKVVFDKVQFTGL